MKFKAKKNKSNFKPKFGIQASFRSSGFQMGNKNQKPQKQGAPHRSSQQRPRLEGVIKRHPDGFGFFLPDQSEHPDVYIPKNSMQGVMTNDRVEIEVFPEHGTNRYRGEVVRVLSRSTKRVSGQFVARSGETGILYDRSLAWGEDLTVEKNPELEVKNGDWVSVEIIRYPGDPKGFCGRIVAVIGDHMDPQNDSLRVLHASQIPFEFSKASLKEAEQIPNEVTQREMQGREDLRHLKFVTIDGKTAKDFDDAVYVERDRDGYKLWVAIADVSHYVREGTAIDKDAYERGTSTYFPNFVAPMLPEKLSNHLCSLNPKVPRLSFVSEMKLGQNGNLIGSRFYEAVILSHARVTYGEAQEVIDGNAVPQIDHVRDEILMASNLAKILMAKRFNEGSLDLEIPESEIELDETGVPVDIIKSERLFAHRLIEELMLMANIAVAKVFTENQIPSLYRIHERPRAESIMALQKFIQVFGSQASLSGGLLQKRLTQALQDFSGHPKAYVMHVLTLRSMSQAKYSPNNVGHFGLNFADYAHFTSPIRRYPDLIVHRQLKAWLKIPGYSLMGHGELESAGSFLSSCEQRSVRAERNIQAIKKARFIRQFLGQEFEGVISSVTKFGVFVSLRQFDVDGLVRAEDLFHEPFVYDSEQLRLVAKRSGMAYCIGDTLKVQVVAADVDQGQVTFAPGEHVSSAGEVSNRKKGFSAKKSKKSGAKSDERRRSPEDDRRNVRKARVSKSRRKGKARSVSR